jgi:hypothetical protein
MNCLGEGCPIRLPLPAAGMIAATFIGCIYRTRNISGVPEKLTQNITKPGTSCFRFAYTMPIILIAGTI